ncbi:Protein CLMP1-like protein [Vigna angularis]|uniref:Protein CLMP1-like protein n=1 Tax=Phaseolus angularis TaxID=3914 RepID=A0A8T0K657_PHAAN|nr:Protein CLMP1-like protein [Vigna angularis]
MRNRRSRRLSGGGEESTTKVCQRSDGTRRLRKLGFLVWGISFWGSGMNGWKENLYAATERFKLIGASKADISMVLKNHSSNVDAKDGDDKKVEKTRQNKTIKPEISKANQV